MEEKEETLIVGEKYFLRDDEEFENCVFSMASEMMLFKGKEVTIANLTDTPEGIAIRILEDNRRYAWAPNQFVISKKEEKEENEPKIDYRFKDKPTEEDIKNMIELVDLDVFTKIIKSRLLDEGYIEVGKFNRAWARKYLVEWAKAKYRFYKIFGNKLTIEKEVETEKTEEEFEQDIKILKLKFPLYAPIIKAVNQKVIENNEINVNYISGCLSEDSRVKNGMKFTKFMSLYGNKELDIEVSKLYQDKGKSNLVISINPIDYLTVSINKSGWHSCHNFFEGCYRNAGLSYMLDHTSLVGYSYNTTVKYNKIQPFEWNSKKWRQMIYVSETTSAMVFSRQYPYSSSYLSKEARILLEETVSKFFSSGNKWKLYSCQKNAKIEVYKNEGSPLYNDVENGYSHTVVKAKDDIKFDEEIGIPIGVQVDSLTRKNDYLSDEENL